MKAEIALSDLEDEPGIKPVLDGLVGFNQSVTGPIGYRPLHLIVRRPGEPAPVGGLIGHTFYGWLFVRLFWLPEDLRGGGLGAELLRRAEMEAAARGCIGAHLDTFDFQARGFYERQGYAVFGTLADQPPGRSRHFMMKRLDAAAGDGARGGPRETQHVPT